jgi:hypothetical protein
MFTPPIQYKIVFLLQILSIYPCLLCRSTCHDYDCLLNDRWRDMGDGTSWWKMKMKENVEMKRTYVAFELSRFLVFFFNVQE